MLTYRVFVAMRGYYEVEAEGEDAAYNKAQSLMPFSPEFIMDEEEIEGVEAI